LASCLYSLSSTILIVSASHMCRNNLAKKHIQLSIQANFLKKNVSTYKPKYWCPIMYTCEKSPLSHELSYIGLFISFHLIFFCANIICKKVTFKILGAFFSFFETPTMNGLDQILHQVW